MKTKNRVSMVMAGILSASLLAGCSSTNTGSDSKGGSDQPVTIKMSLSGSDQEKKLRYETADLFTKSHPNIKIEWVDLGDDTRYEKTMALISGGEEPDIFYMNDWAIPLAQKGVLMPLDDLIKNDSAFKLDTIYKPLNDANTYQGKLYGLTQEVSPLVVYYNKELFDKAGVSYPKDDWTQDDFIATAKKLTDPAKKQYGYLMSGFGFWGGFLNRNGAHIYTPDGKKTGFDSPNALKALEVMKKVVVDDRSSPNSAEQKAQGQGPDALFRNQHVAMISSGMWLLPSFKAEPLPFKWDVVRMPKAVTQETKAGILVWAISAKTKHKKEAWEALKFFEGQEGMKIVAKYNMALPASSDKEANQIILDSKFPENVKAFVDSAPAVNLEEVSNVKSAEVNTEIGKNIDLMLLGKQSPEEAQKKIVAGVNKILSE
jgi:multiple sugar transport system substrate-binding protein